MASAPHTPQQMALRCQIVLAAAAGKDSVAIAHEQGVSRPMVQRWTGRVCEAASERCGTPGRGRMSPQGADRAAASGPAAHLSVAKDFKTVADCLHEVVISLLTVNFLAIDGNGTLTRLHGIGASDPFACRRGGI